MATQQEVNAWIAANPNATPAEILNAANAAGVTTDQIAAGYGITPSEVNRLVQQAAANQTTSRPILINDEWVTNPQVAARAEAQQRLDSVLANPKAATDQDILWALGSFVSSVDNENATKGHSQATEAIYAPLFDEINTRPPEFRTSVAQALADTGNSFIGTAQWLGKNIALPAATIAGIAYGMGSLGGNAATTSTPGMFATNAYDPIAAMTGAGTGVSDLAALQTAMAAPGATAGLAGNLAGAGLGYDTIGTSATGGGLLGMGSSVTPEITSAAQTLSQSGISPQVIQQAATNPTLAQQISDATGIPTSILSNANAIIPLLAGGATLLGTNAPAQPDVNSLVGAQTAANKEMAQWNTLLANPNQVGPGGSSVYDQATNTFTQTLSPAEQALYEQRLATKGQFGTLAGDAATRMGTTLAAPMPTDSEALRQKVIDSMMGRYKTDWGNREQQKISQLQAAGIAPGTAAYETEMNRLNQQYNDAMQQAQLAAGTESQRAYTMDMGTRNQAVNEATGLFGLGQAENPNTPISGFGFQPGATAQPVNSLAAQQNQYAQNVGQYNANMQGGYGLLGLGLNQLGK